MPTVFGHAARRPYEAASARRQEASNPASGPVRHDRYREANRFATASQSTTL